MRIGILTSGGDCAGLNAVIRGIVLYAYNNIKAPEIIGFEDGYYGLINNKHHKIKREDVDNIISQGGTILGTSRQAFKTMTTDGTDGKSKLKKMCETYKKLELDCLMVLGGAGTHKTAKLLSDEGCNVIGLPKTIDNDIYGTDITFGFQTAIEVVTDCIDKIRTTVMSHGRTMLIEIMGNKAGWLTLYSGIAAAVDMILIPELPFSIESICKTINERKKQNKRSTIIAVAEGAVPDFERKLKRSERSYARSERGEKTIVTHLCEDIERLTGVETRSSVLGYVQRGGEPCAFDRVLCTRLGSYAAKLAICGDFGVSVAVCGSVIKHNSLKKIAGISKFVMEDSEIITEARKIGIKFGDE